MSYIEIKNAHVNNLKNIDVKIPRGSFTVISGVSGSGKSSLAFDTLYAEGQRRYVESLSSYARQFLGRMKKPECDYIKGIPPAIAIEQKVISRNPRSTVGTTTEIYEYLRLLFARVGRTFSPISGEEVKMHTVEDVVNCVLGYTPGTRFMVLSPIIPAGERTMKKQLQIYQQQGYARVIYNNEVLDILDIIDILDNIDNVEKVENVDNIDNIENVEDVDLVIDRLSVSSEKDSIARLTDSVETAFYEGHGACRLMFMPSMITHDFTERFEADGMTFERPSDKMFAFNSPAGACPECQGFGNVIGIDERLVIPNTTLSVYDGCVVCWHGDKMKEWQKAFCRLAAKDDFPIFTPYMDLTQKQKNQLWHGLPSDHGWGEDNDKVCIDGFFEMVRRNQYKIQYRVMLSRYRGKTVCPKCQGSRLRKEASYVKVCGRGITELTEMPVKHLADWIKDTCRKSLTETEMGIADRLLTEIENRLQFLLNVGLGYLTLSRPSVTLSGGESQRINLAKSLGSSLVGSLYVLDEPSIGLHSRDTDQLIKVLKDLQRIGNTVVVVEHDEEIIRAADNLIDIGPGAGIHGGRIMDDLPNPSSGGALEASPKGRFGGVGASEASPEGRLEGSLTLAFFTGKESITVPKSRRGWNRSIWIKGARHNNLKGIDVQFPLNCMTVVTGVSGSGKSSLVSGTLYPAIKRRLGDVCDAPGEFLSLEGDVSAVEHIEFVDQNPIGKSTRSNPVTYLKAYDAIRDLFADQALSQQMGYTPQYFSFNTDGGRCEECKGAGTITVEMQFMADLELMCPSCNGKRFKSDILEVRFAEKNINQILDMSVDEAIDFFRDNKQTAIARRLKPLQDVGLGYIKLGQSSSTLSGGENQRVKLAYYIGNEKAKPTLFIFDEPTTGLHFADIRRLLKAFDALIERGHTILIIEHNMDVIKCADHVIDIGPEGGNAGGTVVAVGTPEQIVAQEKGYTWKFLKEKL